MSTVTRKRWMAAAVAFSVGLLAQQATGAEAEAVRSAPIAAELVDSQSFRSEIEAYIREHGRQIREALNEELRRELSGKLVLATNELRTSG